MRCTAPYAGPVMWLGKYYAAGGDVVGVDPADVARLAGTGKWVVIEPPAPEPPAPAAPEPVAAVAVVEVIEEAPKARRKSKKES